MYSCSDFFDLVSSGQVVVLGGINSQPLIVELECNQSMCVVTTHLDIRYEMETRLHPNGRRCHCLRLKGQLFSFIRRFVSVCIPWTDFQYALSWFSAACNQAPSKNY